MATLTAEPALLPRLSLEPDLFGRVLVDAFEGRSSEYYLRRDDNFLDRDSSLRYFRAWEGMPAHHRCLLNHARGRVLDVGAGAGQHALALQQRGLAVTAIDASPLAVEVCRARGLRDARVMDALALDLSPGSYETILLMGNNLGIGGTPEGLSHLLAQLRMAVVPGGQLLAEFTDYSTTRSPEHLRYHRFNRERGRYPGSVGLRLEYAGQRGPDFDWLLIKLADLRRLAEETGWRVSRCVQVSDGADYAVGLEHR